MKELNNKWTKNSDFSDKTDSIFLEVEYLTKRYFHLHPIASKRSIKIDIKLDIERNHHEAFLYDIGDDPKLIINKFCELYKIDNNKREQVTKTALEIIKKYLENEVYLKDETIINELEVDKSIGNENVDQPVGEEELISTPMLSINKKTTESLFKSSFLKFNSGVIFKISPYHLDNVGIFSSRKNGCCYEFHGLEKENCLPSRNRDNYQIQYKFYNSSPKIHNIRTYHQPRNNNHKSLLKQYKCLGSNFCRSVNFLRKRKNICNLYHNKVTCKDIGNVYNNIVFEPRRKS